MKSQKKKMEPAHRHYNFSYRNIFPYIRNYEAIPVVKLLSYTEILQEHGLMNDFTRAYIEYNHQTDLIKQFWDTWDNERKKQIHTLIYNGANQNLFLVRNSYITLEYFRLLAWAYSPLPPHIIQTETT